MTSWVLFAEVLCLALSGGFAGAALRAREPERERAHARAAALLGLLFVAIFAVKALLLPRSAYPGTGTARLIYLGFLALHGALVPVGLVLGLGAVFRKGWLRRAAWAWLVAAVSGAISYILLLSAGEN